MNGIHISRKISTVMISMLFSGSIFMTGCARDNSSDEAVDHTIAEKTSSSSEMSGPENTDVPELSAESGFYAEPFSLGISTENNTSVYYTTDGTEPTKESTLYSAPIILTDRSPEPDILSRITDIVPTVEPDYCVPVDPVDKAVVIKAVTIDENGMRSAVSTGTYFIGFDDKAQYYSEIPVISLTVDADDLFGYEKGIYVVGKVFDDWMESSNYDPAEPYWSVPGNYTQHGKEWERQARLEIFEGGHPVLSQDVGIRIHGGATRSYAQKSLNIYARKKYGISKIKYDVFSGEVKNSFDGESITEYDSLMLRNSGNDAFYTRFRDKLCQKLVSDRQFLTQGMRPCVVFINGEYWGHYELTEKLDAAFVESHYGVPEENICIVKKDALDEGDEVVFGEWERLRKWINDTDLSSDEEYEKLCGYIDMQSFMDYVSSEIYINNTNWGESNMAMWKAAVTDESNSFSDGKWRFIMFDTDFSSGIYGTVLASDDSFERILDDDCFVADLLRSVMKNKGFRKAFSETFRDIAMNDFDTAKVNALIDSYESEYRDMTIDTFRRFWSIGIGGDQADIYYSSEVDVLRSFYNERPSYILGYLDEHIAEYEQEN